MLRRNSIITGFEPTGCIPRHLLDFGSSPPVIFQWMGTFLQLIGTDAHLICRAEGHHSTVWKGPQDHVLQDGGKYKVPSGSLRPCHMSTLSP